MNQPVAKTLHFKPHERNIFFHILTACNLSCKHCYINPAQHGTGTVSRQTMEQWLTLFYDPKKESNVIFLGGEPTLHPDLIHGIRYARALGYKTITVDSNGFLHHDLLKCLKPEEAVLSFSLDGPSPEVNDALRGEGVFAICTANLQKAISMGFEVSVIYTVSQLNISHLQAMPELLDRLGCKRFFIQVIGLRGKSASDQEARLQVSPEEWLGGVPGGGQRRGPEGDSCHLPQGFPGAGGGISLRRQCGGELLHLPQRPGLPLPAVRGFSPAHLPH